VVKSASLYLVIPAGSAGIQGQGWQQQWGLESLGRAPCHFEFNHYLWSYILLTPLFAAIFRPESWL